MTDGHPQLPAVVIVTGPPASGKTTIADALRNGLGLPLIAKDTLKEALGSALGITDRDASHRLGGGVFDALHVLVRELVVHRVSLIVEGNFSPQTWPFHALPPARVVQVHVSAAPETLHERLYERDDERHPVHYDREAAAEILQRVRDGDWGVLPLHGPLIEVDTTTWPDVDAIVARTANALG